MTTSAQLRNRYAQESVSTASPAKLLVMLYDRLVKDLQVAELALGARDIPGSHAALIHAQAIIRELSATLNTKIWREGENLARLYDYVLNELIQANVRKDATHVRNARAVIEPLRETWHQAAAMAAM